MATEVPVVATDVGGKGELVGDSEHGLLLPAGDADALAKAVMRTIEDRDATLARVKAARRRVEQELSFRARMARVEAVYLSVLNRMAGRAAVQQ
jgi:glycosyltransferase involved in cell wall biosynthesis